MAKGCTVNSFMCVRGKSEGKGKKCRKDLAKKYGPSYFLLLLNRQLTTFLTNKAISHDLSNLLKIFFGDI